MFVYLLMFLNFKQKRNNPEILNIQGAIAEKHKSRLQSFFIILC